MRTVDQSKRRVMTSVMFDQEILEWLRCQAKETDMSISKMIELAVIAYIESIEMESR